MSTGTDAGLTRAKKGQSVYKHAILMQYVLPYAAKTASYLNPKRCVITDGFGGRGRYEDGSAGSAERMMIEAQKLKGRSQVDVFLVEKDKDDFARLESVADEYRARGINVETRKGDCADYLDEIVDFGRQASLFLFLDPCGVNLSMDELVRILSGPRRHPSPATEALLNISADAIRRSAGLVYKLGDRANTDAVDTMCGGRWWRRVAIDAYEESGKANWSIAADAVVEEYARRLGDAASMGWVVAPVYRKEGQQPVYYLVFLTRNAHGFWLFGNAAAKARYAWLEFLESEATEQPLISVADQQKQDRMDADPVIRANIEAMIASGTKRFVPIKKCGEIFGEMYGVVEERVAHKVLRDMVKDGRLVEESKEAKQYLRTYAVVS
ncbi:hypothetical protein Back2_07120 [Nocardioides baekrokdamisoli]|uniref:Three-Cys-motif partner protein TcmP n=1 Tax=Nocardioides baekrokdamisoli TaxID=1804624 RepID=A0A3G9IK36_9ACTN|nr:three-Cys-motif partner protein TcmP [Nocardioides baekrokdamisoli]BBH16425.1 hypothetical protein Back2_07120 [Nocardioides baekrokdamisoli]